VLGLPLSRLIAEEQYQNNEWLQAESGEELLAIENLQLLFLLNHITVKKFPLWFLRSSDIGGFEVVSHISNVVHLYSKCSS